MRIDTAISKLADLEASSDYIDCYSFPEANSLGEISRLIHPSFPAERLRLKYYKNGNLVAGSLISMLRDREDSRKQKDTQNPNFDENIQTFKVSEHIL